MKDEIDRFPIEVAEEIGWYVYRLIDTRNGETFYVGRGTGKPDIRTREKYTSLMVKTRPVRNSNGSRSK